MANFHYHASAGQRSTGRSSVAAAAYRSGEKIVDERTGDTKDYSKKKGILFTEIVLPGSGTMAREKLWNNVEQKHKRKDAVTFREVEFSLPKELTFEQRKEICQERANDLANTYQVGVDFAMHEPRFITQKVYENLDPVKMKKWRFDDERQLYTNDNFHVHMMMTSCTCDSHGNLGKKQERLDPLCGREGGLTFVDIDRKKTAEVISATLKKYGHSETVDHRSYEEQGIDKEPEIHLGPVVSEMKREGLETFVESRKKAYQIENTDLILNRLSMLANGAVLKDVATSIYLLDTNVLNAITAKVEAEKMAKLAIEKARLKPFIQPVANVVPVAVIAPVPTKIILQNPLVELNNLNKEIAKLKNVIDTKRSGVEQLTNHEKYRKNGIKALPGAKAELKTSAATLASAKVEMDNALKGWFNASRRATAQKVMQDAQTLHEVKKDAYNAVKRDADLPDATVQLATRIQELQTAKTEQQKAIERLPAVKSDLVLYEVQQQRQKQQQSAAHAREFMNAAMTNMATENDYKRQRGG